MVGCSGVCMEGADAEEGGGRVETASVEVVVVGCSCVCMEDAGERGGGGGVETASPVCVCCSQRV